MTTTNSSNSTAAPRRPPLHPSIRVDAKTPYSAINLEAFEEDGGDREGKEGGVIDLTTMIGTARTEAPPKAGEDDASFSSSEAVQGTLPSKSPVIAAAPVWNVQHSAESQEESVEKRDDEGESEQRRQQTVADSQTAQTAQDQANVDLTVNTTEGETSTAVGTTVSPGNQTLDSENGNSVVRVFSNKLKEQPLPKIQTALSEEDTSVSTQSNTSSPTSPNRYGTMFRKAALKLRERRRSPKKNRQSVDPVIAPLTPDSNAATTSPPSTTGAQSSQDTQQQDKNSVHVPPAFVRLKGKSSVEVASWESPRASEEHPDDEPASASEPHEKVTAINTRPSIPESEEEEEEEHSLQSMTNDSRSYPTFTGRFTPTESMSTWTGNTRTSLWHQPSWPTPNQFPPVEFTVPRQTQSNREQQSLWESPTVDSSSVPGNSKSVPQSNSMETSPSSKAISEVTPCNQPISQSSSMETTRSSATANRRRSRPSQSCTTSSSQVPGSNNSYAISYSKNARAATPDTGSLSDGNQTGTGTSRDDSLSSAKMTGSWKQEQKVDQTSPAYPPPTRDMASPFAQDADFLLSDQVQSKQVTESNEKKVNQQTLAAMRNQRANLFSSLSSLEESSARTGSLAPPPRTPEEREERLASLRALRTKRQQHMVSPITAGEGNWLQNRSSPSPIETARTQNAPPKDDMASRKAAPTHTPIQQQASESAAETPTPAIASSYDDNEHEDPRMAWLMALRAKRQSMLSSHGTPQHHPHGEDPVRAFEDEVSNRDTATDQSISSREHPEKTASRPAIRYPQVTESKSMMTETTLDEYTIASSCVAPLTVESEDAVSQAQETIEQKESDEIINANDDQEVIDVDSVTPAEIERTQFSQDNESLYHLPTTLRWNRMPPPVVTNIDSVTGPDGDGQQNHTQRSTHSQQQVINLENAESPLGREDGVVVFSETPRSDIAVHHGSQQEVKQPEDPDGVIELISEDSDTHEDQGETVIQIESDDQEEIILLEPDGEAPADDSSRKEYYRYDDGNEATETNSDDFDVIQITPSIEDTVCGSVKSRKTVTFNESAQRDVAKETKGADERDDPPPIHHIVDDPPESPIQTRVIRVDTTGADMEQREAQDDASVPSESHEGNSTRHSADPIAIIHVSPKSEPVVYKTFKSQPVDPLPSQTRPRDDPPTLYSGSTDTTDDDEMKPIMVDRDSSGRESKPMGVLQRARAVLAAQNEHKKSPKSSSRKSDTGFLCDPSLTSEESNKDSIIDLIRMEEEAEEKKAHSGTKGSQLTMDESHDQSDDPSANVPHSPVIAESQTGDEPDSPFENVHRRLVRLDIEDFRNVVMTRGGKAQEGKLNDHLQMLVNKDEDSEGKRNADQQVEDSYSHDLALSDCESHTDAEEKKTWTSSSEPREVLGKSHESTEKDPKLPAIQVKGPGDDAMSDEIQPDGLPGPNPTDEVTLQGDPVPSNPTETTPAIPDHSNRKPPKKAKTCLSKKKQILSKETAVPKKESEEKTSTDPKKIDKTSKTDGMHDSPKAESKSVENSSIEQRTDGILQGLDRTGVKLPETETGAKLADTEPVPKLTPQTAPNKVFGSTYGKNEDTIVPSGKKTGLHSNSARVRFQDIGKHSSGNENTPLYKAAQLQEADDETDTSDARDSTTKVSYLETDEESDIETAFESSTVPLLVRMLDRGCAWLEDTNTCGLEPPPSLLRETRTRPPAAATVTDTKRSRRSHNKRQKNSSEQSLQSQQSSLPSNLPKPSSKTSTATSKKKTQSSRSPLVSKVAATTSTKGILAKVQEAEKQIPNDSVFGTDSTSRITPIPKSNRPKFNRKVRKGPRSTKKAKTMFDLPMFKSGVDGEYKLSSGFFDKTSDSSSLETITDNSSYDNPIRLEGMEELHKSHTMNDDEEYDLGVPTPKASNVHEENARNARFFNLPDQSNPPFSKLPPFPDAAIYDHQSLDHSSLQEYQPPADAQQLDASVRQTVPFKHTTEKQPTPVIANETEEGAPSRKIIDITSSRYCLDVDPRPEKEELSYSPRKQGLPPSPNLNRPASTVQVEPTLSPEVASDGSEILTFQDKLQQRLTRVREIAPTLLEESSDSFIGGDVYEMPSHVETRDPDEEISEPVLDDEDACVVGQADSESNTANNKDRDVVGYQQNHGSEHPKSDEENNQGNSSASSRSHSEHERLAALALAEKLRQRAAKLKENRRKRDKNGGPEDRPRKRPEEQPRERITA